MRNIISFLLCVLVLIFVSISEVSAQVVINEFMPDASTEWVEFHNASSSAEYIKNYWIDDDSDFNNDSGSSSKKQLTNLNISNVAFPYFEMASFLNNGGDYVVLFAPDGTFVDQYVYYSNPGDDVSIGRNPDSTGAFTILETPTKGSANSGPKSTPTPESTSVPTPTPAPTSLATLEPTVIAAATKRPIMTPRPVVKKDEDDDREDVLGLRDGLVASPTPESEEVKKKFPFMAGLFLFGGTGLIGVAGFTFIKNKKKEYNKDSKKKRNDGFNKIEIKRNDSKKSS
ncbi:hypothetical protein DRH13_03780 [Candidatus Woesebacteria bacterium]|nr:MAG: hypothetical protein DRH13_03780 [Candidatus Woesebacteria bacterium]